MTDLIRYAGPAFDLEELPVTNDPVGDLAERARVAAAQGRRLVTMNYAIWAPPAAKFLAALDDPRMQAALANTSVVLVNFDQTYGNLGETGINPSAVPAFSHIGADGRARGEWITGGAWGADVVENMAPMMQGFVQSVPVPGAAAPAAAQPAAPPKKGFPPRLVALGLAVGGGAAMLLFVYLGFMSRGKGVLICAVAGIAGGVGLTQLAWPPRPAAPGDERSGWQRAHWLQKGLWILGGIVGVLATAIAATMADGKY